MKYLNSVNIFKTQFKQYFTYNCFYFSPIHKKKNVSAVLSSIAALHIAVKLIIIYLILKLSYDTNNIENYWNRINIDYSVSFI